MPESDNRHGFHGVGRASHDSATDEAVALAGMVVYRRVTGFTLAALDAGDVMAGSGHDQPIEPCPWQVRFAAYSGRTAAEYLV